MQAIFSFWFGEFESSATTWLHTPPDKAAAPATADVFKKSRRLLFV
jgi:hypothetical protein